MSPTPDLSHTVAILGFNDHGLTLRALRQLRAAGCADTVLFFDNGSQPSFEPMVSGEPRVQYVRSDENIFVNPAWNRIFDMARTRYLTLLNNDCFVLSPNYFQDILPHMDREGIALSSAKTLRRKRLPGTFRATAFMQYARRRPLRCHAHAHRQGWLMTIDLSIYKTLAYKIPAEYKIWYGDDWIWGQIVGNGYRAVVYRNRYAFHLVKPGILSPDLQHIFDQDHAALQADSGWYDALAGKLHHRTRIFSRYV